MTSKPTKILLVEDNAADARFTKELLPAPAYTFIGAQTLAQAMDCIKSKRVDVVLLDLALPDSHGIETVAQIISKKKELPIVVLTGLEDLDCAIEALRVGAHDYIVKGKLNEDLLSRSIELAIEAKKHQLTKDKLLKNTRFNKLAASIGHSLVRTSSLKEMLVSCSEAISKQLEIDATVIWTLNERGESLSLQAGSGLSKEELAIIENISLKHILKGKKAIESSEQICDTAVLSILDLQAKFLADRETTSTTAYPLLSGDRLVGVLAVLVPTPLINVSHSNLSLILDQIALGIDKNASESARALLATIVQCSEDGIISIRLDGEILTWNNAAKRIFGYCEAEILHRNISIIMDKIEATNLFTLVKEIENGKNLDSHECIWKCKDDKRIDVSLTLSPIKDNSDTIYGVSLIARDITSKKHQEKLSLAQSKVTKILSNSESLAQAAPELLEVIREAVSADLGILWNFDNSKKSLNCVEISHQSKLDLNEFVSISKHIDHTSTNSLPGMILESRAPCHLKDLDKNKNLIRVRSALKAGLSSAIGFPIMLNKKVFGVIEFFSQKSLIPEQSIEDLVASVCYQVGQFIDKKNAEEIAMLATRARQKVGQAIMENAPLGIAWLDRNLIITEANLAFCRQFGIPRAKIPGTFIFQIDTGIPNEWLVDVIVKGTPFSITNHKTTFLEAAGPRDAYCDMTIWPVKNVEESVDGLILLNIEVTERVKLSKQREDFVATLTHDLKNPLIGQTHVLECLVEEQLGPLNPEQKEVLHILQSGTRDLLELIKILLEVYRYEEGLQKLSPEPLEIKSILNSCISSFKQIALKKEIEISSNYPALPLELSADRIAIKRVVSNLLGNAIKFTDKGGKIEISYKKTDSAVSVYIKDNGFGIDKEEINTLFQRFSQLNSTRKNRAGTGLGLYLCRQIVEAHGGNIICKSKRGSGSEFVFTIPITDDYNESEAP